MTILVVKELVLSKVSLAGDENVLVDGNRPRLLVDLVLSKRSALGRPRAEHAD